MNQQLQDFARAEIGNGLAQLPETWQHKFRLMYGRQNGKRSIDDALAMPLADVIGEIPPAQLDWAMQQVNASLAKAAKVQP